MTVLNKKVLTLQSLPPGSCVEMVSKSDDGIVSDVTLVIGGLRIALNQEILQEIQDALKLVNTALTAAAAKAVADAKVIPA